MTDPPLHSAFGLGWRSPQLPLPELPRLERGDPRPAASVRVRRERAADWPALPPGPHDTPWLQMARGDLRLEVEGIARFRISDGACIAFEPWQDGVSAQDIRTYLLGSAAGALLIQRGVLVLHGNALERGGEAIVCLGHSGAGKSTLAYGLMRRGWRLLADDLVAITPAGEVLPGIPRIKLWEDAAAAFGLDPRQLAPIQAGMTKYQLLGEEVQRAEQPARLAALYLIDRCGDSGGPAQDRAAAPITSQKQALLELREQAFRPLFVRGLGQEGANFLALARLLHQVPLARLPVPMGISDLQGWLAEQELLRIEPLGGRLGSASWPGPGAWP